MFITRNHSVITTTPCINSGGTTTTQCPLVTKCVQSGEEILTNSEGALHKCTKITQARTGTIEIGATKITETTETIEGFWLHQAIIKVVINTIQLKTNGK